jgi:hypothetical protein
MDSRSDAYSLFILSNSSEDQEFSGENHGINVSTMPCDKIYSLLGSVQYYDFRQVHCDAREPRAKVLGHETV